MTEEIQWKITLPRRVFRFKFLEIFLLVFIYSIPLVSWAILKVTVSTSDPIPIKGEGPLIYDIVTWIPFAVFVFFLFFFTVKKPEAIFYVDIKGAKRILIKPFSLNDYLFILCKPLDFFDVFPEPTKDRVKKIGWAKVHCVISNVERHTIVLYKRWFGLLTLRYLTLYCLPENYENVLKMIQQEVMRAAVAKRQ